ncbi:MAG: hypothetical protein GX078_07015 [Clostridiales bacterium]|nr:hypothetical protein [Clostridiales bacterium]
MAAKSKIKIVDNDELRQKIYDLYENADKETVSKWAIELAKVLLIKAGINYGSYDELLVAFKVNEYWQEKTACVHDIRQVGFMVHKLAREEENPIKQAALRAAGQAVSTAHMKEHAMICSDYAIKTIGLLTDNDLSEITKERKWQLNKLRELIEED